MSDERWLSKDDRAQSWDAPKGTWQRMLCDHAEAADELIAELAEQLSGWRDSTTPCDCWRCTSPAYAGLCGYGLQAIAQTDALLARVDALTKDTA